MALTVTHPFVSLEPAKTDPAEVGGADWNADHTLSGTLPVANGGTGSSTASDARTALGLGTISTQNSNSVTITGGSVSGATVTVSDAALTIQDNSDATKQLVFQLSGITAGQTRTLTVPDASTTLVGQDTTDSLTNKVTVDTTNLEVSNIKAKDGTAAGTITDTTGVVTLNSAVLTTADINGGTIDSTTQASGTINGPIAAGGTWTAAATWTLPAYTLGGTVTLNGQSFSGTCANGGTFTTIDINGGTVDGAVIGGSNAAAVTGTTITGTDATDATSSTAAAMKTAGGLAVAKKLFVGTLLDLSTSTAGQIKFPATQNASSDANTLDDYEEGTWTPGIAFGGAAVGVTYSSQSGVYTKIGRVVNFSGSIILTSNGSSTGSATVTGLPFTCTAAINFVSAVRAASGFSAGSLDRPLFIQVSASGTSIALLRVATDGATASSSLTDTEITDTATFTISGHYTV